MTIPAYIHQALIPLDAPPRPLCGDSGPSVAHAADVTCPACLDLAAARKARTEVHDSHAIPPGDEPETRRVLRMRLIGGGRVCDLKPGMVLVVDDVQHVIAEIDKATTTWVITSTQGHAIHRHYLADAEYGEFVEEPEPTWTERSTCRNCGRPVERHSLRQTWFHPTYRQSSYCDASLTASARPTTEPRKAVLL